MISNNTQSVSFGQLGGEDGLRFLGPIRGVLPLGPNGVPVPTFNTLRPSPFSDNDTVAGMISYNYTLEHQGLASEINCSYVDSSPIRFGPVPGVNPPWVLQFNATCDDVAQADVLENVQTFVVPNANGTLGFWACQSQLAAGQMPTYFIYLRGRGATGPGTYQDLIGNVTCTVSSNRAAIYPVTYQSLPRIFSSTKSIANSTQLHHILMESSLMELAGVIRGSQNTDVNLVAESAITFGARSLKLPQQRNPKYLELYKWMIQGILEYEVRRVYSGSFPFRFPYRDSAGHIFEVDTVDGQRSACLLQSHSQWINHLCGAWLVGCPCGSWVPNADDISQHLCPDYHYHSHSHGKGRRPRL